MGPLLMLYAALASKVFWLGQEGLVCAAFACLDATAILAALVQICCKDEGEWPEVMSNASPAGL